MLKKYIQLKKRHFTEKRIAINWNELSSMGSAETVLHYHRRSENTTSDNIGGSTNTDSDINNNNNSSSRLSSSSRKRPLDELDSRRQVLRRTDKILGKIQAVATEENATTSQLLGILLTRCSDQESRDIGHSLWDKSSPPSKKQNISVDTSLVIYTDCNLGRNKYTTQKRVLAAAGHDILPAWRHLGERQKDISPIVMPIPISYTGGYFTGVYFNLIEALKCTISRVLETISEFELQIWI